MKNADGDDDSLQESDLEEFNDEIKELGDVLLGGSLP
jgi:hypothetical protein